MARALGVALAALCGALLPAAGSGRAQTPRPPPSVAVLNLTFYGAHANSLEPGDSLLAERATERLLATLRASDRLSMLDSARVTRAVTAAEADGERCTVACARDVGRALGARWVAKGQVNKTSNLIWVFTGQLIEVATGRVVLDDEYELKGQAATMVPAGAHVFAQRVERAVSQSLAE